MKIYRVPHLNDYEEYRGNFIHATSNDVVAFLDRYGKMMLLNAKVQEAVLSLFDELRHRPPEQPAPRTVVGVDHFDRVVSVSAVERLAKAFRSG